MIKQQTDVNIVLAQQMPLFPDEVMIAVAVLESKRAKDWKSIAKYLEDKHGFPRIEKQMGGRYWLAVLEFFRNHYRMDDIEKFNATSSRIKWMVPPGP